jgi:hypothetical protein
MAMSLEVAEHLPAEAGDTLVQSLTAGTLSLRQLLSALPAALVRAIQGRIPKAVRPTRGA